MWSDLDSREEDVDRGPIPLDIDNVHLLLQGASFSLPSPDTDREALTEEINISTFKLYLFT